MAADTSKKNSNKPSINRNPSTILEHSYWVFCEELGIPEDLKDRIEQNWKPFAEKTVNIVGTKIKESIPEYASFNPQYDKGLFNPAMILGSTATMYLILNHGSPVTLSNGNANDILGTCQLGKTKESINQPRIKELSRCCIATMESTANIPSLRGWKLEPDEQRMNGTLCFTFRTEYFTYDIYPVLSAIDGTFLLLHNTQAPRDEHSTSKLLHCENPLDLLDTKNEARLGFYELIKFWKVIIHDWKTTSPFSTSFSSSFFDSLVYHTAGSYRLSRWRDEEKFFQLFATLKTDLRNAVKDKKLPHINNPQWNLLENMSEKAAESLIEWIDELPNENSQPSLLDLARNAWDCLLAANSVAPTIPQDLKEKIPRIIDWLYQPNMKKPLVEVREQGQWASYLNDSFKKEIEDELKSKQSGYSSEKIDIIKELSNKPALHFFRMASVYGEQDVIKWFETLQLAQ